MWGKIIIPMYRLWLHCLYGPWCPLSPKRPINSLSHKGFEPSAVQAMAAGLSSVMHHITWTNANLLFPKKPTSEIFKLIPIQGIYLKKYTIWKCLKNAAHFNLLWPSDAIWQHNSGSTLAQVMACCLTAPSHYRNNADLSAVWFSDINLSTIHICFCYWSLKLA